ncbi:hypothetical protein [Ottowia sp.]|uniref:hypothetical protein n=1 Tax=Ottowia sp. TaxID=1898956 RepID=UPI0025CDFC72|nr:hypothetical protein [Ottowia sp.]MBK6616416.1 hypothetical protein [Ottowia sp.]
MNATDLKALVEGLKRDIAAAEHKPGQWASSMSEMGGVTTKGEAGGSLLALLGGNTPASWGHFSYKRDGWLAISAVNSLPVLLALAEKLTELLERGASEDLALRQFVDALVSAPECGVGPGPAVK